MLEANQIITHCATFGIYSSTCGIYGDEFAWRRDDPMWGISHRIARKLIERALASGLIAFADNGVDGALRPGNCGAGDFCPMANLEMGDMLTGIDTSAQRENAMEIFALAEAFGALGYGSLGGMACSFDADVRIVMADGTTKRIADVQVGDEVLATDPVTGETGPRRVVATLPHDDLLVTLRTSSGEIVTTEDHKYWNLSDHQWQESQDIDPGDDLLTVGGDKVTAEGLDWNTLHTAVAYDLDVADIDTFYVAVVGDAILVHNCDPKYVNPGHHDPSSPNYNANKSALPGDAEELFASSIDVNGTRWTKVGTGRKAVYHRFSDDNNGNWHWSGSTAGTTSSGESNVISMNDVPIVVKRS